MLVVGLEPTNPKIINFESTASTIPPYKQCTEKESNLQPSAYQTDAIPFSYR